MSMVYSHLNRQGKRTIRSLVLGCLKRYPVPMTAWQIGRIIQRNPASTSSQLCHMNKDGEIMAFLGKRKEILYAPKDLNAGVQCVYSFYRNHTTMYKAGMKDRITT